MKLATGKANRVSLLDADSEVIKKAQEVTPKRKKRSRFGALNRAASLTDKYRKSTPQETPEPAPRTKPTPKVKKAKKQIATNTPEISKLKDPKKISVPDEIVFTEPEAPKDIHCLLYTSPSPRDS